ncbi:MAG: ABC transporter ATP-binding protein, partial [Candidatus Bipolaricaulaceae bacterium]
ISGLVRPRQGEVLFQGRPIHRLPAHQIVALGVGHVPEGRKIFPRLTVEENLEIGAYLENDRKAVQKRKEEVFSLFPRLYERRAQKGGTLSGGEQQMLAVARALMAGPKLLLLDEPSLGLAPVLITEMYRAFARLKEENRTILLVEQNARAALSLADHGYVLETGRIVAHGPTAELRESDLVRKAYLGV